MPKYETHDEFLANYFKPLEVKIRNPESVESTLDGFRRFKMIYQKEGIAAEFKAKQRYEKPSDRKRREKRENIANCIAEARKEELIKSGEWDRRILAKQKKKAQRAEERKKKKSTEE